VARKAWVCNFQSLWPALCLGGSGTKQAPEQVQPHHYWPAVSILSGGWPDTLQRIRPSSFATKSWVGLLSLPWHFCTLGMPWQIQTSFYFSWLGELWLKSGVMTDVPEGSFIVRAHTPMANLFSCLWFNEVDRFTPRDQLSFAYTYLKFVRTNPSVQFRLNMFKVLELHIVGMISFSTECCGTLSILSHTGSYYDVLFCHTRISVNCWIGLYMLELNKDQNSNQLGNPFAAVFHMAIFFNPKRWAVEYNMWSLSFFYCQCLLILTWLVSLQDCERKAIAKLYHHRQDERPGKGHAWPCLGAID